MAILAVAFRVVAAIKNLQYFVCDDSPSSVFRSFFPWISHAALTLVCNCTTGFASTFAINIWPLLAPRVDRLHTKR